MNPPPAPAPQPTHRLVPARFPPIGLFDTVTTAADLAAVMELVGWTDDQQVATRIARLPRDEWVFGTPYASIVMAAFLHGAPTGMRFNGPELGAWYAAADLRTAAAEVGHHLRREAAARGVAQMHRGYRAYSAHLLGLYRDIRGAQTTLPDLYAPARHDASQIFGENIRATGGAGILYDSLRHRGGHNIVAYRPRLLTRITPTEHYNLTVSTTDRRITLRRQS